MTFDYSLIPKGFYDSVLSGPDGLRKFWHYHKFESVLRYIPSNLIGNDKNILDIGCFAGSFLGMIPQEMFSFQLGVDILPEQIDYANQKYGTPFRQFKTFNENLNLGTDFKGYFHVITLIEVIEHLNRDQIIGLLTQITEMLHPDGKLIITTPNYMSLWPVLELLLNHFSDIQYEEQHLTKFSYYKLESNMKQFIGQLSLTCEAKTTTHFLSPFIAPISYNYATKMATKIPSTHWKNPFGNIILSRWSKS
jgi:2-polyprenyl-3-methyl-5-hydroxy-6-metoxy-1,4-benzoquinol methylase